MNKHFYDTVRPLFGGRLTQGQVDGMGRIVEFGVRNLFPLAHLAYVLATIFHETGRWMQPIREGALRFGPNYTDAQARNAVAVLFAKGIIRRNYALPTAAGHSYYGRGLVQITHDYNYEKFGIADDPDRALEWDVALDIAFRGMRDGMFTGHRLDMIVGDPREVATYIQARAIVNGDVRANGRTIAEHAVVFYNALQHYTPEAENGPASNQGTWPPRWWPFPTH